MSQLKKFIPKALVTDEPEEDEMTGDARYDALPKAIKGLHNPAQFSWLSDAEKNNIVQNSTEPEFT